jgi:predicted acylesterase/phospholipase RssA
MKGGITSGIVYPGLICKLAERYQFQSIGGTSAGAIAAALTAAAEYARRKGNDTFEQVARVPGWLGATCQNGSGSNLLNLFRPQKETRVLFRIATAFLIKSWFSRLIAIAGALWLDILIGFLPVSALLVALRPPNKDWHLWLYLVLVLFLAVTGIGVSCVGGILLRTRSLPSHHFGLCTGWKSPEKDQPLSLIQWLYNTIQEVSKLPRDRPLTFGDLKTSGITLKMICTSLTFGRPYTLPFETSEFYFSPTEMGRFFPPDVVRWMEKHPGVPAEHREEIDTTDLVPLPDADNLPVILATRLSLSFPFLFCAVPLYAVDWSRRRTKPDEPLPTNRVAGDALGPHELRRPETVWFSDGGICSNFPLHLFDSPLPRWPTFAVDLRDLRPDRSERVWMPKSNREGIAHLWTRVTEKPSLATSGSLFSLMFDAARNWMDNLQAMTPGYRDRIVHIYLDKLEGGLNLNMPPDVLGSLSSYGEGAADKLIGHFLEGMDEGAETEMTWDNHRWIRYRTTMALLESFLSHFSESVHNPEPDDRTIFDLIDRGQNTPPVGYRLTDEQKDEASHRTTALDSLGQQAHSLELRAPKPSPALRARPTF